MKNFIFKSKDSDLQKMFQSIETIQKNVLYVTHRVDLVIKLIKQRETNENLQTQVDEYFDRDTENIPDSEFKNR